LVEEVVHGRTLLVSLALALAVAPPPAFAVASQAPTLRSETTQSATATGPANAPTDATKTTPATSNDNAGANAKTPLTKGTVKKLPTSTSTQTSDTSTPDTSGSNTSTTTRRSARHRRSSASARSAAATRRARAASAQAVRPARRSEAAPRPGRPTTPAATTSATPRSAARRGGTPRPAAAKRPSAKPVTGLGSIDRVADRVIEVVPGVLILALVVLTGLVLVLVVRSWLMERRRAAALQQSYGVTVQALATAIEAKDHTTGGHIERVRELGLLLARELAPRDVKDPQMAYGFLLHDIGKLAIPDAILRSSGRLSEDEWALMRRHPDEGVRILSAIPFLDRALEVVRHHHERWDGGGYPDGLSGTDIPLWARVFSVVDALDAMTAERPYRPRQPYPLALEELRRNAGTQFDPNVVEALERIDGAEVERLLEPAQVLDRVSGGAEAPELEPLEAILAASESARVEAGDVAPSQPKAPVSVA
jgi:HD-GYP domain-containing protein (c-di-GMP phosphodiesterase class II)